MGEAGPTWLTPQRRFWEQKPQVSQRGENYVQSLYSTPQTWKELSRERDGCPHPHQVKWPQAQVTQVLTQSSCPALPQDKVTGASPPSLRTRLTARAHPPPGAPVEMGSGMAERSPWRLSASTGFSEDVWGLPWWPSGQESSCQRSTHRLSAGSREIPHTTGQLSPRATITEPACPEPRSCNQRGCHRERPTARVKLEQQ